MGAIFEALTERERFAIAEHAWEQFNRLIFQTHETAAVLQAQSDPQAWMHELCDLIASDPKRVRAIVASIERGATRRQTLFSAVSKARWVTGEIHQDAG